MDKIKTPNKNKSDYFPSPGDYAIVNRDGVDLLTIIHVKGIDEENVNSYITLCLNNGIIMNGGDWVIGDNSIFEQITEEQFQSEFNKFDYKYDPKTHTAIKKRWRAEIGNSYWTFTDIIRVQRCIEDDDKIDQINYDIGNYFQTEEIAQRACDLFLESLKKFNNNLK